jgi:hypothetical protein
VRDTRIKLHRRRPVIAGLAIDDRTAMEFRGASSDTGELHCCRHRQDLVALVDATPDVVAILTELWDVDGRPMAPTVRDIKHAHPATPVIAYCRLTPHTAREMVTMAAAGVSALALRDQEDLGSLLWTVLHPRAYQRRSADSMAPISDASTAGENR